MIRKILRIACIFTVFIMLVSCDVASEVVTEAEKTSQTDTAAPTEPEAAEAAPTATLPPIPTAEPTAVPVPSIITRENVPGLKITDETSLENPYEIKWSAESNLIGVRTQGGLVLLEAPTLSILSSVMLEDPIFLVDYAAATQTMATTSDQQSLELRDITTGEVLQTIETDGIFTGAAFSDDGLTLVTTSGTEFAATLWDTKTGENLNTLTGFETAAPVYSVKFSPDTRFLIWWARASVQVMHIASEQFSPRLSHEDFVGGLELSPDGRTLAAATAGTINDEFSPFVKLWDANSGISKGELLTGQQIPYSLSFSPDGKLLAASANAYILVWDVETQNQLVTLFDPDGAVNSVAFSPDGRTLASSTANGSLRLWQISE